MIDTYRKLWSILTKDERRKAILVFVLVLGVAISEVAGVASILPFVSVLTDHDAILNDPFLSAAFEWSNIESVSHFSVILGLVFLFVFTLSVAMKAISQWVQLKFTKIRVHEIGLRLMKGYLNQPYEWFLNRHTARMATTILSEVNRVISQSLFPAIQLIAHGAVVLCLFLFLLVVDWALAIGALTLISLAYGALYSIVRRPLFRFGQRRYVANMDRFKITQETFGGIKDIKIRGLESAMCERFSGPSYRTANEEVKASALQQIPGMAMQVVVITSVVGLLLFMSQRYGSVTQALPTFSAFAFAGYRLMPSLQTMYRQITNMRANGAALDALILQLQEISNNSSSNEKFSVDIRSAGSIYGDLELREIQYRYPGSDSLALYNLEIKVPINSRVGLVGSSGSGKTTTVDIILGLLYPEGGEIRVGEDVLTAENIRMWQRNIGYVPQHIFLSDESVAGNIAFGVKPEEIDIVAVENAAKVANLHSFIIDELADGYETIVGERGLRLSGGQRQRIGIARALYHNPSILILDEATSALDNLTERVVMEAVEKLAGKKTIIMIAHRLSTVENCDNIFVLKKGEVVASGTYSELLQKSESFQELAGNVLT